MIIWILALVLVLASAALGYTWGAVRTGITMVGLMLASVLAAPVAPVLYPLFDKLGLGTKLHAFFIAPLVVILVVMVVFKVVATKVHNMLDTHYKYHAPDFVQTLWLRTNERFGAALSVVNATIYLLLICVFIQVLAYPVSQLSSGDQDSAAWRYLLKAHEAMESTRMNRVAAAFNPAPKKYYEVSDLVGMVYHNPLLVGRLTSYPPIMELGEREEYRLMYDRIAGDVEFKKTILSMPKTPFQQIMGEESFRLMVTNRPYMNEIFKLDFKDLSNYLATGKSAKFDEAILGRWVYNYQASLAEQRRTRATWKRAEYNLLMASYTNNLHDVTLLGLINNKVVIKSGGAGQPVNILRGTWSRESGDRYTLQLDGPWEKEIQVRGSRLYARFKLERETRIVVFERQ
ncbi:CvpA family protein [Fontisphaera persica]|uniref:CvpA family protein n=1 Tax=Fontisphaera persica TaxID=2974023 RepID=UPI0024C0AD5D|nr:CvpA family protein [Fontisphaera persica]WCJ58749.1 CvpA family protein [Fontisphaera persica]